eukprot:TRINITY_DN417_c0_g1_i2.p1 TRINITY_DN417_c0_g1~~TRINITY_DN417_c0_g1_i2.p1  ORF type:complete len:522 (-),score=80.10 TRINITY_DN417_c0_g1_i2:166-1497(-)
MALPMLPKRGGWVCSSVIMTGCCYIIAVSGCDGICRTFEMFNKGKSEEDQLQAYEDIGRQALGRRGELLVSGMVCVYFLGCLAGYTILISEQLEGMCSKQVLAQTWKCILFLPFCASACLRDMSALAKLVPLGVVAAFTSCFIICAKAMLDSRVWADWETNEHGFLLGKNELPLDSKLFQTWPVSSTALGSVTGIIFGAFGVNANIPSVLREMRDPSEMPKALRTALATCLCIYLCIMLIGHYGYGNFVQGNLLDSMMRAPVDAEEAFTKPWCWWTGRCGWKIALVMQVCVLTNLVISFPLNLMAVIQSFESLEGVREKIPVGSFANYSLRISLVAIIFAIAFTIDKFGLVFGLFASLCGPVLQAIFPIMFGYLIQKSLDRSVRLSPIKVIIVLVASFCFVVGFIDSVNELFNNWGAVDECSTVGGFCTSDGEQFVPSSKVTN